MSSKKRLGRGLDGLIPQTPKPVPPKPGPSHTARIEELHPNRDQPRRHFDEDALEELASSIAEHGILEPILVRQDTKDGFEIIAGERRWRAAQKAGLKEVPIFVRDLDDAVAFEAALVENLQREDLNPIETALAFQRLMGEFGHTQEQIAKRVGKDRSSVANSLRLLKLPKPVLDLVADGSLSEGHGRALLQCDTTKEMQSLARTAAAQKLSVREVEKRARKTSKPKPAPASKSANVKDLERRLSHALGTTVTLEQKGKRGVVAIHYADYDQLDAVLAKLGVS